MIQFRSLSAARRLLETCHSFILGVASAALMSTEAIGKPAAFIAVAWDDLNAWLAG